MADPQDDPLGLLATLNGAQPGPDQQQRNQQYASGNFAQTSQTPPAQAQPSTANLQPILQAQIQRESQALQSMQPTTDRGGMVKKLLGNFFAGAGAAMQRDVGLPTQQQLQQQHIQNLTQLSTAQSMDQLRQLQEQHYNALISGAMQQQMPMTGEMASNFGHPEWAGLSIQQALALAGKVIPAQVAGQAKTQSADITGQYRLGAAQIQGQTALDRLRATQQFGTWKTNQDNQTKLAVANLTANKAPAAIMQSAEFAQSGLNRLNDAEQAINQLEQRGILGTIPANKMEDYLFGNGLVDPSLSPQDRELIGKARAALSYTSSAAMRAHTGRTSHEIYQDFTKTLGMGQSSDALKGAIQETRSMLSDYAGGATNAAIQSLRGMANGNNSPQGGTVFARDPQGKLHQAPAGTKLPQGWTLGR